MTLVQQCPPWLRDYGDYKAFRTLLEVQEQIVTEIEGEQKLVDANKRLNLEHAEQTNGTSRAGLTSPTSQTGRTGRTEKGA